MAEPANPTWQAFFDVHAPNYLKNVFTQWTSTEVSFLEEVMGLQKGWRILDMGCGVGRHCIELAKRGYQVVGIDISAGMLEQAREAAKAAGVQIEFIQADAATWSGPTDFDAAICLCEGGFGLVNLDQEPVAHDLGILRSVYRALKPGAPFVLTALNGYAIIRRVTDEMVQAGQFDPASMLAIYPDEWDLPEGKRVVHIKERMFIPPELVGMLRHVGFDVEHVWGGTAGEWGKRPIKLDEIEAMYIAKKPKK